VKNNILLITILVFSFILFTFKLSTIPSSVYVDEATVGYNALSILKTGSDEFGQKHPIYFRFFGAYTPGLFVYFILPFIKILGMSALSIRLLSAISGTISVLFFYKTLKLLSKNALVGTLFYTILPWTVFNSRLGYEVMFASTLFNIGCFYLLKNINTISYLGLFLISLSTYASHTQRYLAPTFLISYFIFYKKIKLKPVVFLLITQIPNIIMIFTQSFWVKNNSFSLKYFIYQIITYLSPKTLFFSLPDIDLQHQVPQISVFFWWMIIPLVLGVKKLFFININYQKFLIIWLICSLIPASLSGEFISIQRALPLLFPLMLLIALGLSTNLFINAALFIYSIILLFRSYFVLFPKFMAPAWNYGYQELSQFMVKNPDKKFLIYNDNDLRNYILPLYYLQLPYQNQLQNYYSAPKTTDNYSYLNLVFKQLDWGDNFNNYDYVVSDGKIISPDQAVTHHLTKIKTITTPLNATVLEIFKVGST